MTPTPTQDIAQAQISTFCMESPSAAELFITAVPSPRAGAKGQATEVCTGIARVLEAQDAWVMQERVFASSNALELICAARSRTYAPRAGGVLPLRIETDATTAGEVGGIQIHALCKMPQPEELCLDEVPAGRIIRSKDCTFLTLSAITSPEAGACAAQAFRSFEKAETLLKKAGGDFRSVARTWWWLKDICAWYGEFNQARREFFTQRGLLGAKAGQQRMPASTGIGMRPLGGASCALDVVALVSPTARSRCFDGAGNQRSAYDYGSAFSRAAMARTPGGETVFVSGTAAINAQGETVHRGDAAAQIENTLGNVCAVLRDMQCQPEQVVQAIAYCKTPEVEQVWRAKQGKWAWPVITVLADVCRDELLFELEATALPGLCRPA